jgi:hypothetical protein
MSAAVNENVQDLHLTMKRSLQISLELHSESRCIFDDFRIHFELVSKGKWGFSWVCALTEDLVWWSESP